MLSQATKYFMVLVQAARGDPHRALELDSEVAMLVQKDRGTCPCKGGRQGPEGHGWS